MVSFMVCKFVTILASQIKILSRSSDLLINKVL